ncbi:MAG: MarR family transcriptional regulator [Rickettsiaceae bacterium]|nr:MarR family transcriptional regulator [Rickettsiaceae bacterium]
MISPEDRMLLSKSIESSRILSTGQKKILKNIIKFEHGIAMSTLVELMNQSKQALFSNIKKLVERGFLIRQKEMVYIYKANEEKMIEIINTYKKIQENK